MAEQYSVNGDITLDNKDFKSKIKQLEKGVEEFSKEFEKTKDGTKDGMNDMGKGAKKVGDSFSKQFTIANIATSSLMKGMSLLNNGIGSVIKEYAKLDKGMAKINTLTQGTTFSTAMYRDELFKVSEQTGYFASDLAEASYQALSAGVAVEDLGGFISQMAKAAKGGFTDVTTAVDATTSVMNAYGKGVYSVNEITDKFIATQNRGKTTFDELGRSAALFVPIAAQLGIGLDEVLGMMASITRVGVPTSQAATQINRVMLELADSSAGAGEQFKILSGQSFPQFVKEGGNLTQALKILSIGAEESGQELVTMFGRAEAGKAAVVLMKDNANDLATSIESVGSSAGDTEKANKIATTNVADEWSKLKVSVVNDVTSIGKAQEGLVYKFLKGFNDISEARKTEQEKSDKAEEVLYERRDQLQEKYIREGLSKTKAYWKAVRVSASEIGNLGTEGLSKQIKTDVPAKKMSAEDEQASLIKSQEIARKQAADQVKVDAAIEEGNRIKAIEKKKSDKKQAIADNLKAKKEEAEQVKAFREQQQIDTSEFNTKELTEQFNFMQAQAELRDQGKITNDEFNENAKAFMQEQLLEADQQRIDELAKEAEYYKNKEDYAAQYNKALEKLKRAELKLLKDKNKEKKLTQKEEFKMNEEGEKFTRATYRALMNSHGNMLKDMATFFKDYLAQLMIQKGEGLVVKGTTDVLEGIAISANPLTPGAGAPLIAAGGAEVAQGLVYGAAGAALGSVDIGGGDKDEDKGDVYTSGSTPITDAKLEDLDKEDKPTVTYMLPNDSQLMDLFMPKLKQAFKDGENVILIPEE